MRLPQIKIKFPKKKNKCYKCSQLFLKKHTCNRDKIILTPIYHDNCHASSDGKKSIRIDKDGICFRCGEFFPEAKERYEIQITNTTDCKGES